MNKTMFTVWVLVIGFGLPACKSQGLSENNLASTDATVTDGSGVVCSNEADTLTALINAHRTCNVDSDCKVVTSGCLMAGRVTCTPAFYVNTGVDDHRFTNDDQVLSACSSTHGVQCRSCEASIIAAACIAGQCAPACHDGGCTAL